MGVALGAGLWSDSGMTEVSETQQFQSCEAFVSMEGDVADFKAKYEGKENITVSVPFSLMGMLYHEVRYAAQLMIYRQRMRVDKGVEKMLELCATALRPSTTEVILDKETRDRVVIYQFAEHSPFCVRMSPDEVESFVIKLKSVDKSAAH
ncbi:hypothetical protein A4R28_11750 [Mesorhizobium ciceri]|nr:hypothetical protein A4R28_11750 [Mesorhizobium ciceri]RUU22119.1 hypothetical protein EOC84_03140 [Mesorhizobium sp. Primo-B]TPI93303.1 hypothetical protein FJ438_03180 [Mesorhizobium sp. B2-8-7]TPJ01012.1 hypothetical protein FJ439_08225 [Mesorhizobium sp. B2-8-6]